MIKRDKRAAKALEVVKLIKAKVQQNEATGQRVVSLSWLKALVNEVA